jgi:hypothetical protein
MRHISIFRNNLQSFDGLGVAYDIVEEDGAIFLNPGIVNFGKFLQKDISPW